MPLSGQGRIGLSGPEKQVLEGTLVGTEDSSLPVIYSFYTVYPESSLSLTNRENTERSRVVPR